MHIILLYILMYCTLKLIFTYYNKCMLLLYTCMYYGGIIACIVHVLTE